MKSEKREPLYYAKREFRSAEKSIERMRLAEHIEDFEDEWKNYLNNIEKIWVKTERACQHIKNKFQPWQGKFARERKKDALLKYIKHARNSDQHSIGEVLEKKGASKSMYIEGGEGRFIDHIVLNNGVLSELGGNCPVVFEILPDRLELLRVKDSNKWYNPPMSHKNAKLMWSSPIDVATLGLEYYRDFVEQTESKFFNN